VDHVSDLAGHEAHAHVAPVVTDHQHARAGHAVGKDTPAQRLCEGGAGCGVWVIG
jgi:hypothetical protein